MSNRRLGDLSTIATGWIFVVSAVVSGVKGFFPDFPLPDASITLVVAVIGFVVAWLLALFRVRSPAPGPFPFPETLWRLLLKQVRTPVVAGDTIDALVKVVIVHDSSSRDVAHDIQDRNEEHTVEIRTAEIEPSDKKPLKTLTAALEHADAVYFVWTREIRSNKHIAAALDSWAQGKKDIPVLVINTIPEETYELKFSHVPVSKAQSGLSLLLLRSNVRAGLWVELAGDYRRWWVGTFTLALLTTLAAGWLLHRANDRLRDSDRRDRIDKGNFSALAAELFRSRKNAEMVGERGVPERRDTQVNLVSALSEMADFVARDIVRDCAVPYGSDTRVTIYRTVEFKDGPRVIQVAASRDLYHFKFHVDCNSIVGCSIVKKAFVLWRAGCAPDSPSAWDLDGNAIGVCAEGATIRFPSPADGVAVGALMPLGVDPSFPRKGLLCFSPEVPYNGMMVNDTAVCLDTALNPAFMDQTWVRAKLQVLGLAANSVPTGALLSDRDLKALENERDVSTSGAQTKQ